MGYRCLPPPHPPLLPRDFSRDSSGPSAIASPAILSLGQPVRAICIHICRTSQPPLTVIVEIYCRHETVFCHFRLIDIEPRSADSVIDDSLEAARRSSEEHGLSGFRMFFDGGRVVLWSRIWALKINFLNGELLTRRRRVDTTITYKLHNVLRNSSDQLNTRIRAIKYMYIDLQFQFSLISRKLVIFVIIQRANNLEDRGI